MLRNMFAPGFLIREVSGNQRYVAARALAQGEQAEFRACWAPFPAPLCGHLV